MKTRPRMLALLLGASLAVTSVIAAGHASSDVAVRQTEICYGEVATIVGAPEQLWLSGTNGPDVIVTNGAQSVDAQGGDDLVCVTNARSYVVVDLGPGADRLVGSDSARESVDANHEAPGDVDRDIIHTGGGNDSVRTGGRESGAGASQDWVGLGNGRDTISVTGPVSVAATFSGGRGRDQIAIQTRYPRGVAVTIDNRREELRLDNDVAWDWDGFQDFFSNPRIQGPFTFRGSDLREALGSAAFSVGTRWKVDVRMGGGRDWASIGLGGHNRQLDGGSGADWLRHWDRLGSPGGVNIYGRAGNDRLIGSDKDDALIGGSGYDTADGRGGRDRCRAELRRGCES